MTQAQREIVRLLAFMEQRNQAAAHLIAHGVWYQPQELPADVRRMPIKRCFDNAFRLAERRPDLCYVEGYAFSLLPVEHGWCVDEAGHVIDPTWASRSGRHRMGIGEAYLGIVIPLAAVRRSRVRFGSCSALFDYRGHFPLVRELTGDLV